MLTRRNFLQTLGVAAASAALLAKGPPAKEHKTCLDSDIGELEPIGKRFGWIEPEPAEKLFGERVYEYARKRMKLTLAERSQPKVLIEGKEYYVFMPGGVVTGRRPVFDNKNYGVMSFG